MRNNANKGDFMGKFDGYLLLSDIDGTLTDSKGKLPQSNADAIHYFQSEGGLFTVASGRFPDFIDGFSSSVKPNTHIIGINGTVIYDWQNKKDLVCHTLDEEFISLVYDIIETRPELDSVYISHRFDNIYIPREKFAVLDKILEENKYTWYRAMFCQSPDKTARVHDWLIEKYGDRYSVNCSWNSGIEVHSKDSGKGAMLEELSRIVFPKGEKKLTVAVGDYENDVSMLLSADIGYAVANGIECAKKAADRLTVSNNEGAIAAVIEELEAEMK